MSSYRGVIAFQIVVWRRTAPPGMPRYTFYRHVLPVCGAVVADAKQMIDGERFWGDQVYEALEHGLYVYRVNLAQQVRRPIRFIEEYLAWQPEMRGQEVRHEQERLLITDQPAD